MGPRPSIAITRPFHICMYFKNICMIVRLNILFNNRNTEPIKYDKLHQSSPESVLAVTEAALFTVYAEGSINAHPLRALWSPEARLTQAATIDVIATCPIRAVTHTLTVLPIAPNCTLFITPVKWEHVRMDICTHTHTHIFRSAIHILPETRNNLGLGHTVLIKLCPMEFQIKLLNKMPEACCNIVFYSKPTFHQWSQEHTDTDHSLGHSDHHYGTNTP